MKNTITILFLFLGVFMFSQEQAFKDVSESFKESSKIDKNDKVVSNLLDRFYQEVLQSDNGELGKDTPEFINKTFEDKNLKNGHILFIFFLYQDYISQTAAVRESTDSKYQLQIMNYLFDECKGTWGKVPAIIYIYKSEALDADKQSDKSAEIISEGLKNYPDSVPLKVYQYLKTKDETLKNDLVKNHSNHWLVLQDNIQ